MVVVTFYTRNGFKTKLTFLDIYFDNQIIKKELSTKSEDYFSLLLRVFFHKKILFK